MGVGVKQTEEQRRNTVIMDEKANIFFPSKKHFKSKLGSGTERFILPKIIYMDTNQWFKN